MPKNSSVSEPSRLFARRPLVIAHRGASGEAPENTLEAIRLATEKYRVDLIEIDLRLSKEGIPMVIHDETLDRTTSGQGRVRDYSVAALKRLDAGYGFDPRGDESFPLRGKGVTIPTLEEVLRSFHHTAFCLEIKEKKIAAVEKIAALIRRIPRQGPILIGSFHGRIAREARQRLVSFAESFFARDEVIRAYLGFRLGLRKLSPPALYASIPPHEAKIRLDRARWIEFLHRQGVWVFYWTVNDVEEMKTLLQKGADGILTDFPGRLNQILGR